MNIFYPEYLILIIFIVIASWRILSDAPGGDGRKKKRRITREADKAREKGRTKRKSVLS